MTTQAPAQELLQEIEANAVRFGREAGDIALRHFRTTLNVEYKARGQHSPVTVADRESEEYLRKVITESYPDHNILGEEGEDLLNRGSEFTWVLDPVDGTANFISGLPLFAVSIGVLHRGEPVVGAIFVPTSGLLQQGVFHAYRGGPAYLNDTPIMVAQQPAPEPSVLAGLPGNFGNRIRFKGELRHNHGEPRTLGSVAVELALTAQGTLQYAFFNRPKIWDVAAGVLILRQAGGLTLIQERRHGPWNPLNRFNAPPGQGTEMERLRNWGAGVVVGNAEMCWTVASCLQPRMQLLRPVGALIRKAKQLPLLRD